MLKRKEHVESRDHVSEGALRRVQYRVNARILAVPREVSAIAVV